MFTTYFGEQNFADGRPTFITGEGPYRVGPTNDGIPVAKHSIGMIDV